MDGFILSVVVYGVETWPLTAETMKKLRVVVRHTSNDRVRDY